MSFIRSISGLRATLGDDMLPSRIADYAAAFATMLPEGLIVVGRDGRPSGLWMEQIVCGALAACGRDVLRLGMALTPTVQLFAERPDIAGGIAITASHNPAGWNGMKFLNGRGIFLNAEENERLWKIVDGRSQSYISGQQGGHIMEEPTAIEQHIASILSLPVFTEENGKNLDHIRSRHYLVVVDAVNCSGSYAVPQLLERMGCTVIPLYCDGSGIFPHTPEPVPDNLGALQEAVREYRADIGIAVDPDADRLVLIDENGNPIGEENTIVLAVLSVLSNQEYFKNEKPLSVATNLSTTKAVDDLAAQFGATALRTPVGEINVVEAMLDHGSVIGGEGSGGVILPSCHAGRDSLVGIGLTMLILAQKSISLSSLVGELPHYSMVKLKKTFAGQAGTLFDEIQAHEPNAHVTRTDGLKLSFADAWVHLRTSNTEPIIRIIAEAPTPEEAGMLAARFMEMIP